MSEWQPIETAPDSEPILVNAPGADRGRDSCEVVVVVRTDGEIYYWTNGGPNGGSDLFFKYGLPTHWMPLPPPPALMAKRGDEMMIFNRRIILGARDIDASLAQEVADKTGFDVHDVKRIVAEWLNAEIRQEEIRRDLELNGQDRW